MDILQLLAIGQQMNNYFGNIMTDLRKIKSDGKITKSEIEEFVSERVAGAFRFMPDDFEIDVKDLPE